MKRLLMPLSVSAAVLLLTVMCIPRPPGSQKSVDLEVVVNVFADLNGDGQQDKGEPGIPGTLVAAHYNEHGFHARRAQLTGENGQATFTGIYTHFFDVGAATPCGYQATTETTQSAAGSKGLSLGANDRQLDFGFLSDIAAVPGAAQITFELWEDLNGDGQRDPEEETLAGQSFAAAPYHSGVDFLWPDPADMDDYSLTSGPGGVAKLDLGNSCGQVAVRFPLGIGPEVTSSQPTAASADEAEDILIFNYDTGMTRISIGLKP